MLSLWHCPRFPNGWSQPPICIHCDIMLLVQIRLDCVQYLQWCGITYSHETKVNISKPLWTANSSPARKTKKKQTEINDLMSTVDKLHVFLFVLFIIKRKNKTWTNWPHVKAIDVLYCCNILAVRSSKANTYDLTSFIATTRVDCSYKALKVVAVVAVVVVVGEGVVAVGG